MSIYIIINKIQYKPFKKNKKEKILKVCWDRQKNKYKPI